MTQRNINAMDLVVNKMAEGKTLARALQEVYSKRHVCIPYDEDIPDVHVKAMKMSNRTTNSLLREKLMTFKDIIEYCETRKITSVRNFGVNSGRETFEAILNYCWDHMSAKERTAFLIDTVERNSEYIREEIIL